MAVAGDLVVNITGNTRGLQRATSQGRSLIGGFADSLGRLGLAAQGIGVVARAFRALASPLKIFNEFGDSLAKQSIRTGVSVEALSDLSFAAGQSGSSIEVVEKGLKRMATTLFDAEKGSKESSDALQDLGFSVASLKGLSPDQQFIKIGDALGKVTDASRKAALAQKIFGRAGTELLPLFSEGVKGIKALTEENRRIGGTISTADAKAAEAFNDAIGRLKTQFKATLFTIGKSIATMFNLTDGMGQLTASFSTWKGILVALLPTIALVGIGIVALGVTIKAVTIVTIALKAALVAFNIALLIFSPTGLIIAGIALIATGIFGLLGGFKALGDIVSVAFGGIVDALKNGDIERAWEIVTVSLQIGWLKFVRLVSEGIAGISEKLASLPVIGKKFKTAALADRLAVGGLDVAIGALENALKRLSAPRPEKEPAPLKPPQGGPGGGGAATGQIEGALRGTSEFFRRLTEIRQGAGETQVGLQKKTNEILADIKDNTKPKPVFEGFNT